MSRDKGVNKTLKHTIEEMKSQRVVEEAEPSNRCFVSHLFLRPKKDGDFRAILNLSKLNEWAL